MKKRRDPRPAVAVGHVSLPVTNVPGAVRHFELHGMRTIVARRDFAVLELRGGTRLVVKWTKRKPKRGAKAPFDLMVDDIDVAWRACERNGMDPSAMRHDPVHRSFDVVGPDGYRITITSSHAGTRPV